MKSLEKEHIEITMAICNEIESCYKHDKSSQSEITGLYFKIGKCISQQGEKAYIPHLEKILTEKYTNIKGFSMRNLRRMRDFYLAYNNSPLLLSKVLNLNWTQNTVILEYIENPADYEFYIDLATQKRLSKLALIVAIEGDVKSADGADIENEIVCNAVVLVCDFTENCVKVQEVMERAMGHDLSNQCNIVTYEEQTLTIVNPVAKPVYYKRKIPKEVYINTEESGVGNLSIEHQRCQLHDKKLVDHTLLAINLLPKIFNSSCA